MMPSNTKSQKHVYSLPLEGTAEEGYSPIHRHPQYITELPSYKSILNGKIRTGWDIFQHGLRCGPDSPCLGTRICKPDGSFGEYSFKSYKEVEELVQKVGSGILGLKKISELTVEAPKPVKTRMLGIYSSNSIEWLICEQVCNAYGLTLVPIYDTLGKESTVHILENSDVNLVVCDVACAQKLMNVLLCAPKSTLNAVIVTGVETLPENLKVPISHKIALYLWDDVISLGLENLIPFAPSLPEQINTISYTSGTSGIPKGVIITQGQLATIITVINQYVCDDKLSVDSLRCYLSYLPLAHMYERIYVDSVLFIGGRIGIYSGEVRNILEDLNTLKPTVFVSVPRLFFRIHDKVLLNVNQKSALIRWLFHKALDSKLQRIREYGVVKHSIWDRLVFNKFPALFGGNIMLMMTGSAPLSPIIYDRIRAIFATPIISGYGLTETAAGGFVNRVDEADPTHVGGPIPSIEFRLRSLPEFEYFVDDENPRGELMLRGTSITPGYFRNEKANSQAFQDGWFMTGDIVELLPNGAIRVIDRRKNLFKLVQGEYVSPEKLESIIIRCPLVSQAFVTGNSQEVYPVAIVVPDEMELRLWAKNNGFVNLGLEELCRLPQLKEAILKQMDIVYNGTDVKGYERCKQIHVESEPFSIGNNLLTTTGKLLRHVAAKRYSDIVKQLYSVDKS